MSIKAPVQSLLVAMFWYFAPPIVQVAVSSGEVGSAQGGHNEVHRTLGTPEAVFSFGKGRL